VDFALALVKLLNNLFVADTVATTEEIPLCEFDRRADCGGGK
jgi:hypothetical protein